MTFSRRTAREILRDPLNLGFGLGFPLVLLLLMTLIQKNIPIELFTLEKLTPGMSVFGMSFLTLPRCWQRIAPVPFCSGSTPPP
jgi:ABC-2 type transport system permease protein